MTLHFSHIARYAPSIQSHIHLKTFAQILTIVIKHPLKSHKPFCIIAPFYGMVDVNFVAETKLTIKSYEKDGNHFSETRKTVIINYKQQA